MKRKNKIFVLLLFLISLIMCFSLHGYADDNLQEVEYLSDAKGFKAMKALTSAGKCVLSVFFPAQKAAYDLVDGVSLTYDVVDFVDKIQKDKPDWLATADTGVSAVNLTSNIAETLSTKYSDKMLAMTNKVGGKLPGFSVVLACGSTGHDIYKLITSYVDAVDFAVDTLYITPIQKTLPKNDFQSPPTTFPDNIIASKYKGNHSWQVELRLRQIGGDPSQVGTHWDRIYGFQQFTNDFRGGLFYEKGTNKIITSGEDFGKTPGKARSPLLYSIINEPNFAGQQGVREGTNTYEAVISYQIPSIFFNDVVEDVGRAYFSVFPDSGGGGGDINDPDVDTEIDDWKDQEPPSTDEDPGSSFRTPGNDHADENLSVANKDVPDGRPNDLREAYTLLAVKKGFDLVITRELLKEARHAEKHWYSLLLNDQNNPEYQWKWAGATHRIKTHSASLKGHEKEMLAEFKKAPNVAILDRGYSRRAYKLLRKLSIPAVYVGTDFSPDIVRYHPILYIPSAGLYGLDRSAMFKARLEEYVRKGGTIICLAQQHGSDFQTLPGGQLTGYGWLEDQSCHTRSLSISALHPVIFGQDEAILDAGVDGFFTQLPPDTQVLMRRTKNNMPAVVEYPYGKGRVLALCLYSDWISGLGGETRDDRALIADIIHWAEDVETGIPHSKKGQPVTVPITLTNSTSEEATHILFYTRTSDGTIFKEDLRDDIPLDPNETKVVEYTLPGSNPNIPGIWSIEYILLNIDGITRIPEFEEPEIQFHTLGTRLIIEEDLDVVTALNKYNFYITSSQETFFRGETGSFVFTVENNSDEEKTFVVKYYFPHHTWTFRDFVLYGGSNFSSHLCLQETLTIPSLGKENFTYQVPIRRNDRIFASLFDETGSIRLKVTDRQIIIADSTQTISIVPSQISYEGGENVAIDLCIENQTGEVLDGEVVLKVRDPQNSVMYSEVFNLSDNEGNFCNSIAGFTLSALPEPGYYTIRLEVFDNTGNRIGAQSSVFEVPDKPLYCMLKVPDEINPQEPTQFTLSLNNAIGMALQGCTVDFYVESGADTIFHQNNTFPTLPPETTTLTYDVDFSSCYTLGQYIARFEVVCEDPDIIHQGQKTFSRSLVYYAQLDQKKYLSGGGAVFSLTLINNGIFHETVTMAMEVEGSDVTLNDTLTIPSSQVLKESYPFVVPDLPSGPHTIHYSLEEFAGLEKGVLLLIRLPDVEISFPSDMVSSGQVYTIELSSLHPLPTAFDYTLNLRDHLGSEVYEQSGDLSISSSAPAGIQVTIPVALAAGQYYLDFQLLDPDHHTMIKKAIQTLRIQGGISVEIQSVPNEETYQTGDSAIIITTVTATEGVLIDKASLEVSVVSTVDTGEFEWAKDDDMLLERASFQSLPLGDTYYDSFLSMVDLDSDGDKDIVSFAWNKFPYFYENESVPGQMKWTLRDNWRTGYSHIGVAYDTCVFTKAASFGDLNGDHLVDVLAKAENVLRAFKNVGSPQSPLWEEDPNLVGGLSGSLDSRCMQLIDIDQDGDLDLYTTDGSTLRAYRNNDINELDSTIDGPEFVFDNGGLLGGVSENHEIILFVDLDGDAKKDMMYGYYYNIYNSTNYFDFYLNKTEENSSQIVWEKQTEETINENEQVSGNRWGFKNVWELADSYLVVQGQYDADHDGRDDFVLMDKFGIVKFFADDPNSEANTYDEAHYYTFGEDFKVIQPIEYKSNFYSPQLSLADLNGDGKEELIATVQTNDDYPEGYAEKAWIYENIAIPSAPVWERNKSLEDALNSDIAYYDDYQQSHRYLYGIFLADLDGDGFKDVVTYGSCPSSQSPLRLWCYKNMGNNPVRFESVDWLDAVWDTIPKHYKVQWMGPDLQIDKGFIIKARDFDGDGDNDLFISYAWDRYYYLTYLDYRGTFVAYENTGNTGNPTFVRKSAWDQGLREVVLPVRNTQYCVDLIDVDEDGTLEAFVGKKQGEGITGYRYNGSAWVVDADLTKGITLTDIENPTPNFFDLNHDDEIDLIITKTGAGGSIDPFHMSRENAFEIHETTEHTFTTSLSHETSLGVIPVPGHMKLTSRIKSEFGQILAEFHDQFYVLDSGQSVLLKLQSDKVGYKSGETVSLSGKVRNMGASQVSGNFELINKHTGESLFLDADVTLGPDEEYPFNINVENVTESFLAQASFNDFSTLLNIVITEPDLDVFLDMPSSVKGEGTFTAVLNLANPTTISVLVTVSGEGEEDALTIAPMQTEILTKTLTIHETKDIIFEITGDYEETIEKIIVFEEGSSISFDIQDAYPVGYIAIPYTVTNDGALDDAFELQFSGAINHTVLIDAPAGSEFEYILEINTNNLGFGEKSIGWEAPQSSGSLDFRVVKENDITIQSITYTGLEGNEETGFFAGFDCTLQNLGLNDFTGVLVSEIEHVSGTKTNLSLDVGEEKIVHMSLPAPDGNGTFIFLSSVILEQDTITHGRLEFTLTSGFEVLSFPVELAGAPETILTFEFLVKNTGIRSEMLDAVFTFPFGFSTENAYHEYINPNTEVTLSYAMLIADDAVNGAYTGSFSLNENDHPIPFQVAGVSLTAYAELDKDNYLLNDTCSMSLSLTNEDSTFNGTELYAVATYDGHQQKIDFELEDTNELVFDFEVIAENGRINWGIYQLSGRSIVLNDILVRTVDPQLSLVADKSVYNAGETVTIPFSTTMGGTLTIKVPDLNWEDSFEVDEGEQIDIEIPLDIDLASGTYIAVGLLEHAAGILSQTVFFDVIGRNIRPVEFILSRGRYFPRDVLEGSLTIESNVSFESLLVATISSEAGAGEETFRDTISLNQGKTTILINSPFETNVSGIHFLNIKMVSLSDETVMYTSCSKAFDVGGIVLVDLSTDKERYSCITDAVALTLRAYGSEPGDAQLYINGDLYDTVSLVPQSFVEEQITIPAQSLDPGEVIVEAKMTVNGLESQKQTRFLWAEDLPDLIPIALEMFREGSEYTLSGKIKNEGESAAENIEVSLYLGSEDPDNFYGTAIIGSVEAHTIASFEMEGSQDLEAQSIVMVVELLDSQELDTTNNTFTQFIEEVNHSPRVTFVGPSEYQAVSNNQYEVTWTADDEDGDTMSVDIFFDFDSDPNNGRIAVALALENIGSFIVNLGMIDEGSYYVSVTVTDTKNATATGYSEAKVSNVDTDGDGIVDDADNCVTIANPNQEDGDEDNVGDLCDAFPGDGNEWLDADEDGVGDNADPDDDNDDLPDTWERDYNLDPYDDSEENGRDGDLDLDGWTNYQEYIGGAHPNDSNDVPDNHPSTAPSLNYPENGSEVTTQQPVLSINNSMDDDGHTLTYTFEIYSDEDLANLVISLSEISEGENTTSWQVEGSLEDNKTFYWRARAFDGIDYSDWMETASFFVNTVNDSPSIPTISSPPDQSEVTELQPTLEVGNAHDSDQDPLAYEFEVYADVNMNVLETSIDGLSEGNDGKTSWQVDALLDDNTFYWWRAQARDDEDDASGWTTLFTFFVNTSNDPPTAPSLNYPENGSEVITQQPVLSINNSLDDDGLTLTYTFEIYSDEDLTNLVISVSEMSEGENTTSWQVEEALDDNMTLYWRARAFDGIDYSDWMETASLFVNTANDSPSIPTISSPPDQSEVTELQPTLEVGNAHDEDQDPLSYEFEVYADVNMSALETSLDGLVEGNDGTTSWQVDSLLSDNAFYWWRVQARDNESQPSGWTTIFTFFINTSNDPPSAPEIFRPQDGEEVETLEPTLEVKNSTDWDYDELTYFFEVDSVNTFDGNSVVRSPEVSEGPDTSTSWSPTALLDNILYYWQAKSFDGAAHSTWTTGSFFVNLFNDAPSVPTIKNPVDNSTISQISPTLVINLSQDIDHDAINYAFEVYADTNLSISVTSGRSIESSWHIDADLADEVRYYWRAKAIDEHEESSQWSDTYSFLVYINEPPTAPTLNNPISGGTVSTTTPELSINNAYDPEGDALEYLFELYSDKDLTNMVASDTIPGTEVITAWIVSPPLDDNSVYYWRVRASDGEFTSSWMPTVLFEINTQGPDTTVTLEASQEILADATGPQTIMVEDEESPINGVSVHIPQGALDEDCTITIGVVNNPPALPDDTKAVSSVIEFGPSGLTFAAPITIKVPYTQEDLDNAGVNSPEELEIYTYDTSNLEWLKVPVDSIDEPNGVLICIVDHFSMYTLGKFISSSSDGDDDHHHHGFPYCFISAMARGQKIFSP